MGKNRLKLIVLFLFLTISAVAQTCVEARYLNEVGVKEATGKNDGKRVEMYLKSVKLPKGNPWCAAFVHWVLEQCGVVTTITGWSPTAHNGNNLVYFRHKFQKTPKAGDVFTLYSVKQRRIFHTGFFHQKISNTVYETVEGNTSGQGVVQGSILDVNGDGVYKKKRSFNATYGITRWTN